MSGEKLPVDRPEFWKKRLEEGRVIHTDSYHAAVYITSIEDWTRIQTVHREVLARLLSPQDKVLDAGCGYGALLAVMPEVGLYWGVDLSPDLIQVARGLYPQNNFLVGEMQSLPMLADQYFDWAICRSIREMIQGNCGDEAWKPMEQELLRVSKRILLLSYTEPEKYEILNSQGA